MGEDSKPTRSESETSTADHENEESKKQKPPTKIPSMIQSKCSLVTLLVISFKILPSSFLFYFLSSAN